MIALKKADVKLILHCFGERNASHDHLQTIAERVFYYPRRAGIQSISFTIPYIVRSRWDETLAGRLLQDDHTILMEGIHCTFLLNDKRFYGRKMILRLHNTEHLYYRHLYLTSNRLFNKIYYRAESALLKRYEKIVARKASIILAVSNADVDAYAEEFNIKNTKFLPVFTGFKEVSVPEATGTFCLYHGNLAVNENEKAALWLIKEVFNHLEIPLVIAGRAPSERLIRIAGKYKNTSIIKDPSESEMQDLVRGAQCHVLPSFNTTGVKLKLINALFNGRHCIVNLNGASGSGLEPLCTIAHDANDFRDAITRLFYQEMTGPTIAERKLLLEKLFDEEKNCSQLIQWIW